jgi:hypothetical protein
MRREFFINKGDVMGITFGDNDPKPVQIAEVIDGYVTTIKYRVGNFLNVTDQDSLQYALGGGFKKILMTQINKND